MAAPISTPVSTMPYLDPTVIQAEAKAVVTFLDPIVAWIPGPMGTAILAMLNGLAANSALVIEVCDVVNEFTGAQPPTP